MEPLTSGKSNAAIRPECAGMRCVAGDCRGQNELARRGSFFGGSCMDVSDRRLVCRFGLRFGVKALRKQNETQTEPKHKRKQRRVRKESTLRTRLTLFCVLFFAEEAACKRAELVGGELGLQPVDDRLDLVVGKIDPNESFEGLDRFVPEFLEQLVVALELALDLFDFCLYVERHNYASN